MAKDTYYFSHDYSARSDQKIKNLIRKHGMLGYGIFWSIVEDLYNNANALQTDYKGIAFDLHTTENIVKSIINDFELFVIDEEYFGSISVERRLNARNERSESARLSAISRWEKYRENANAMQTHSDGNAIKDSKVKERKGKEIKINISQDDIESVYLAYPSKCPIKNSSTGKTKTDKDKIKSLLLTRSKDELLAVINSYVADCKKHDRFIKNFKTFLNNIPDIDISEPVLDKQKERIYIYYLPGIGERRGTKAEYDADVKQYGKDVFFDKYE